MPTSDLECGQEVRGANGATCLLRAFHKGYHSSVVSFCDACDRAFRGEPSSTAYDREGDVVATFCFLCTKEARRGYGY